MVGGTWIGSPFPDTDGKNQGYITHLNWGDNTYCIQTFHNVNGSFLAKFRRKDFGAWSAWKDINELDLNGGLTRAVPKFDYSGGVDANTLVKAGWYKLLADPNHSSNLPVQPTESTGWWYVQTLEYNEGAALQQYAYSYIGAGSAAYIFARSRFGGTWYGWQKIAGPDVGYVYYDASTISGSVGSVIERGTNANGNYTKFADGTLICWGTPLVIANQLGNGNVGTYGWSYYYENNSVLFPAVFTSAPSVQVTPQGAFLSALVTSASATAFVVAPITTALITAGAPIMYVATGRWR